MVRATLSRLASSSNFPIWTPDGKRVSYLAFRAGLRNLFWRAGDGTGSEERLTTSENVQVPGSFSPDGKWLAFDETNRTTSRDIWLLPLEGERKPQAFLKTNADEHLPRFSSDGRWLAYASNESGRPEVYVQPFPGPGRKFQVSTEGAFGGGFFGAQWNPSRPW